MGAAGYFGTVDYIFMGLYVLILIGLGFYLKRLASRSLDNYICGGKNIPWWAMGISGMASFLDLAGTAVIVSFLFLLGPQGLFVEFRGGAVLVLPFMMLWTGKWHRRSGCLTGAQWNIYRFGDCWGGRASQLMGVIATVLTTIGMLAYLIIGAGIFLSTFLPYPPEACSLALLIMATLYTMMSGFYGVIFTDLFQVCIIMTAVIYISFKAFTGIGNAEEISAIAMTVTGNSDWLSGVPKWNVHVPKGYDVYKHLIIFSSFYLVRTIVAGIGTGADPRYFGAKNDRECGKLSMLWTFLMTFRWPMMIGIAVMGLYLVVDLIPDQSRMGDATELIRDAYPETDKPAWGTLISRISNRPEAYDPALIAGLKQLLGEDQWGEKMNLLSFEGTVNPEKILSAVLMMSVAEGMRGILVIALVAAALSTFGSWVNLATGQFVNDFYKKWIRPKAQTKELIFASWGTVIGIVTCMIQTGGTLTVAGRLDIGEAGDPNTGTNRYAISGGTATMENSLFVGAFGPTGTGMLEVSGTAELEAADLLVGNGFSGTVDISGGNVSLIGRLRIGSNNGSTGTNRVTISGGVVDVLNRVDIGENPTQTNELNVSGGELNLVGGDRRMLIGFFNDGTGTFTLSGAGVVSASQVVMGEDAGETVLGSRGTVNLNGGTLIVSEEIKVGNGLGTDQELNLNGGTIQVGADAATLIAGNVEVLNLLDGGITFDTAGFDASTTGVMTGPGGVTKTGEGLLTMNSIQAYTGPTRVEAGILSVVEPFFVDSSAVHLTTGAELNLLFDATATIGTLFIDGIPQAIGTYGGLGSGADNELDGLITGPGIINATTSETGPTSDLEIVSISRTGTTATITIKGAPSSNYTCSSSTTLTGFSAIATTPDPVVTDEEGNATFTVEAAEGSRFYIVEDAPEG